jgi:hypothetical protein
VSVESFAQADSSKGMQGDTLEGMEQVRVRVRARARLRFQPETVKAV